MLYVLVHAITHSEFSHSEFSQDDVLGTSFLNFKVMPPLSKQTGVYCADGGALVILLLLAV